MISKMHVGQFDNKIGRFKIATYFMTGLGGNRKIWAHWRAWCLCQEPEPKKPTRPEMTHHMMTRSKTRAAAANKAYIYEMIAYCATKNSFEGVSAYMYLLNLYNTIQLKQL